MNNPVEDDLQQLDIVYEKVVQLAKLGFEKDDQEVCDRLVECMNYNLQGGKKYRGQFVVRCFKKLNPNYTERQIEQARIVAWCVELFQSFWLTQDDLIDKSITRRGKPCWYKKKNVGLVAVNDAKYLQHLNFKLLKEYLGDSECYMELVELFLDMYMYTMVGQSYDLISNPPGSNEIDLKKYTKERYKKIITYKTSYYTFSLPIRAALYLSGIKGNKLHAKVEEIMLMVGQLFQIQDDYLDLYGDPKIMGKIDTDLVEGKCSWLITSALELADEEQMETIKEHYGKEDLESIKQIKKVFAQLNLRQQFFNLEENSYRQLSKLIIELAKETNLPESAFSFCLNDIYKRIK